MKNALLLILLLFPGFTSFASQTSLHSFPCAGQAKQVYNKHKQGLFNSGMKHLEAGLAKCFQPWRGKGQRDQILSRPENEAGLPGDCSALPGIGRGFNSNPLSSPFTKK